MSLGIGNPLHPVDAPFVFQAAESALALYLKDYFVEPTQVRRVGVHYINLPVVQLGIAGIGTVEVAGEEAGFIAAGAGANLHYDIPVIVGIFGQERYL